MSHIHLNPQAKIRELEDRLKDCRLCTYYVNATQACGVWWRRGVSKKCNNGECFEPTQPVFLYKELK